MEHRHRSPRDPFAHEPHFVLLVEDEDPTTPNGGIPRALAAQMATLQRRVDHVDECAHTHAFRAVAEAEESKRVAEQATDTAETALWVASGALVLVVLLVWSLGDFRETTEAALAELRRKGAN